MTEYEQMQSLFAFLKVLNNPLKHWSDCVRWEIVKVMQFVVLTTTEEVIMALSFFFISIGEMTIIDIQSWIFVHFYVVVGWKQMPILLTL
jgi:hypothetical protein